MLNTNNELNVFYNVVKNTSNIHTLIKLPFQKINFI